MKNLYLQKIFAIFTTFAIFTIFAIFAIITIFAIFMIFTIFTFSMTWTCPSPVAKQILTTGYNFDEISTRYGHIQIILANENQRKLIQSECTCESITEFMAGHPSGLVQICQKVSRCVRKSICNASILNNVFWLDRNISIIMGLYCWSSTNCTLG